jgi:hypothetical protein
VPTDRATVTAAARELLRALAASPGPVAVRVTEADGRLACLVLVWEAGEGMPTAAGVRRRGERARCRADVLAAVGDAGCPLTRRQVMRALRERGTPHGPGTVAKALAELTAAGELVNLLDRRGYRLPAWPKPPATPDLFG